MTSTPGSATPATVTAPFSADQVASLNGYQRSGVMHPFTCANRTTTPHRDDDVDVDVGLLTATENGWVCGDCDYTQSWAHAFMADRSWEQLRWPGRDRIARTEPLP